MSLSEATNMERVYVAEICAALENYSDLVQVIIGPRQVGKTTAAEQIVQRLKLPTVFESADSPLPYSSEWIETHWSRARLMSKGGPVLLVLDEVQKVEGWSEVVKRLRDEDKRRACDVKALLLGSSALLLQKGLKESLAGRFLLHRFPHWTFKECHQAFGWDLDHWLFFGGYPGAARFAHDEKLWSRYILDSLVDTVLARDVLQLQTVNKPALLRQLFALSACYPSQVLSYNKMLGQLSDAGNTTTLAHYLDLLESAFIASGLEAFSKGRPRKRGSSPKLILWNNALVNALSLRSFSDMSNDLTWRGRLVENAVGAKLLNELQGLPWSVTYWRDGNVEVDFVVSRGESHFGIEVKSGRSGKASGLHSFKLAYPKSQTLLVGAGGVPLEEFFEKKAEAWFA